MIMGDFSAILLSNKKRSNCALGKRCPFFGDFVDSYELQDLSFIGSTFTWQKCVTFERLDRVLANDVWVSTFQ